MVARGAEPVIVDADPTAGHVPAGVVTQAAGMLRAGGVVALPTDTVYGLAALPGVAGATSALFALKQRSAEVPIAVLCATGDQALDLAEPGAVTDDLRRVAARLWPGPLTLVLPRRPGLGYALGEPGATIGVRCPDHALVRALAGEVGPLATTSANLHGEPTPGTAAAVARLFGPGLALVLDGGPCSGAPSAVVDATGGRWQVLRTGVIGLGEIEAAASP